jgi:hypothetical protein
MKLNMERTEARLTQAWKRKAFVVPYRIAGNLYRYAGTDHGANWLPLNAFWVGQGRVFEPVDGEWPKLREMTWEDAVLAASQLARVYFVNQGNRLAQNRLPRAMVIAEARNWTYLGDELDTWLMPSCSTAGVVYQVNGRCTCPDFRKNGVPGGWCKHRLARALAKRAEEILNDENGAGGDDSTPAPVAQKGPHEDLDSSTDPANGQAQRIELIVAYQADEAKSLPRMNANGKLVSFRADGLATAPPSEAMPELYRWLQEQGYTPDGFELLDWEHGLRNRRQTYILSKDRDTALPQEHTRGRAKLFKE